MRGQAGCGDCKEYIEWSQAGALISIEIGPNGLLRWVSGGMSESDRDTNHTARAEEAWNTDDAG